MKPHTENGAGVFLAGPAIVTLLLACFAFVILLAWALRRMQPVIRLGGRARRRLERGRALPMLWGSSAEVLVFAASVLLIQTHVLALLGFLLLASGACLAGAGVAVAAWAIGGDLARTVEGEDAETLTSLMLGQTLLFLVACLPVIGWLTAGLAGASGLGALLEAMLTPEPTGPLPKSAPGHGPGTELPG